MEGGGEKIYARGIGDSARPLSMPPPPILSLNVALQSPGLQGSALISGDVPRESTPTREPCGDAKPNSSHGCLRHVTYGDTPKER